MTCSETYLRAYAKERQLGPPLVSACSADGAPLELNVAVLESPARLDTSKVGHELISLERDTATEIIVPASVLTALGRDVYAGCLVRVTSASAPHTPHIARVLPASACCSPLLPGSAARALQVDAETCTTVTGKPVALLSPLLAYNLGLPFHLAQLVHGSDLKRWLSKRYTVSISALSGTWPGPPPQAVLTAQGKTPGRQNVAFHAATHVGLAQCMRPEKMPPFSVADFQDGLQEAMKAMQGAAKAPEAEEPKDEEADQLTEQQHKERENALMQGLGEYMKQPHFVCLGDVIALTPHSVPLVGPLQGAAGPGEQGGGISGGKECGERTVIFLKVVELCTHANFEAHRYDVLPHAVLWSPSWNRPTANCMITSMCGAAVPVGVEAYMLDSLVETPRPHAAAHASPAINGHADSRPPQAEPMIEAGRLGHCAYAVLEEHQELAPCHLLASAWREIATHLVPLLHPAGGDIPGRGVGGRGSGRAALLVTGPERGGKATEVAAAAAALGIHVLEVDCRSLASGSPMDDAECVSNLLAVIEQARAMAPVILLLRRLERVFPQQPNPAVVRRFADALTDASAALARPHIPELQTLPTDAEDAPQEPPPVTGLPWSALSEALDADGRPFPFSPATTQARLRQLHARFPPAVLPIVATTAQPADVPVVLRRCFTTELAVPATSEATRALLLRRMLGESSGMDPDDLRTAAQATAGFLPCDLGATACDAALRVMLEHMEGRGGALAGDAAAAAAAAEVGALRGGVRLRHVQGTLEDVRKRTALDLGAPRIPQVKWEDVGGLEHVKKAILETIELPLKFRDLFSSGLKRRSGVLLYGPPGTGKTLVAKAVATECSINFLSVKGPELINMYVGESERNVRDVFERARKAQPCVLFFDELDSLAPRRGQGMDSSHVSDRIVAQLLAELDGVGAGRSDVYVIGATNRPDLLDGALLRPGRLDVLLYVGVERSPASKLKVLTSLTRKFDLAKDVSLEEIAAAIPLQCTGADLYSLCADAWMHALRGVIAELVSSGRASAESDEASNLDDVDIVVTMKHFLDARAALVPSLTVADLDKYDKLQDQYSPSRERDATQASPSTSVRSAENGGRGVSSGHELVLEVGGDGESGGVPGTGLGTKLPLRKKRPQPSGAPT